MRIPAIRIALASTLVCLATYETSAGSGVMLDPTAISALSMGTRQGSIDNVINQSGLSPTYKSGVTNFATYTATATEAHGSTADVWQSNSVTTGNVTFTLGGSDKIDSFALWNGDSTYGVKGFTLLASTTTSFTNATNLGSFTANAGSSSAELAQDFTFAATTAKYVEMEITSNYSGTFTEIDEAAFEQVVPEPSSVVMMITGSAGALLLWLRHVLRERRRSARVSAA
jgi:hypothetical protein